MNSIPVMIALQRYLFNIAVRNHVGIDAMVQEMSREFEILNESDFKDYPIVKLVFNSYLMVAYDKNIQETERKNVQFLEYHKGYDSDVETCLDVYFFEDENHQPEMIQIENDDLIIEIKPLSSVMVL